MRQGTFTVVIRNHKHHVIINHGIRPDGTKASLEEVDRARAWNRAGCDLTAKPAAVTASTSAAVKSYKTPELVPSDHDDSSYLETAQKPKVESKVELAPSRHKKRPRDDHAGRESTPPRRSSPRRAVAPDEKKPRISPAEQPPVSPPWHQHPSSYKGRSHPTAKGKEKAAKPAALGAPPAESSTPAEVIKSESSSPTEESRPSSPKGKKAAKSERATNVRGSKGTGSSTQRPVAAVAPKSQAGKSQADIDLAISSSELTDADEPPPAAERQVESDWAEWTDVEPDSDDDITMLAARPSEPPKTNSPPVYTQPDQPIEITNEPTAPPPPSPPQTEPATADTIKTSEATAPTVTTCWLLEIHVLTDVQTG